MVEDGARYWRRNLLIVWISQFLSLMGFSFSLPFSPFYIRDVLGVSADAQVKMYAALATACASLSLAVMSPLWGILADRYGRKPMLLRANFAGAIIVALMGMAPNISIFIALRMLQGLFTGTMSAAMTLMACCAPRNRQGLTLGALSAAVYSGDMTGQFIGGLLVEWYGFRQAFLYSGIAIGLSGLLVLLLVREDFQRPPPVIKTVATARNWHFNLSIVLSCLPLYILLMMSAFARSVDGSQFALFVEFLNGGITEAGAARWTGRAAAAGCIGAMLSGLLIGQLLDRFRPARVARTAALGAMLAMALIAVVPVHMLGMDRIALNIGAFGLYVHDQAAPAVLALVPLRFMMIFFSAGLEPVMNVWLSKITPASQKGIVFGFAVTSRSIGWIFGPLAGGTISMLWGVEAIYVVGPFFFLALVPMIGWVLRQIRSRLES